MDRNERRRLTKEVGLEALYRIFKFAAGSEFLHFGLFEPDIPADFQHIREAQERYLERLIEVIPPTVKSILDVGAGAGRSAEILIERGFAVDCVVPPGGLADIAAERLKGRSTIYRGRFEEVEIPQHYDLVLFSESLQYIAPDIALAKALSLLRPGGHILVSDFFRRVREEVGGGHLHADWEKCWRSMPLDCVHEHDITAEAAPTIDIVNAFNREVGRPLAEAAGVAAKARWPVLSRLGYFLFRRDIDRLFERGFADYRTGAAFRHGKIYKTYLFRHMWA